MKHIYCISGLGADEKLFAKFQFSGYEIHFINWVIPEKNESLEGYAKRLIDQILHVDPILIGVSFGGILCIEISKQITFDLIIIISSIKSSAEMPLWMRLSGRLKLNRIFPMRSFKLIQPIQDYNLGIETEDEKRMVHEYRKNANPVYIDWSINKIINWKQNSCVKNLYHIHGTKDRIFPLKNIKADHVISGGHLMVLNRGEKVNECINSILQKRGC